MVLLEVFSSDFWDSEKRHPYAIFSYAYLEHLDLAEIVGEVLLYNVPCYNRLNVHAVFQEVGMLRFKCLVLDYF